LKKYGIKSDYRNVLYEMEAEEFSRFRTCILALIFINIQKSRNVLNGYTRLFSHCNSSLQSLHRLKSKLMMSQRRPLRQPRGIGTPIRCSRSRARAPCSVDVVVQKDTKNNGAAGTYILIKWENA